jgi:hypothetical protein
VIEAVDRKPGLGAEVRLRTMKASADSELGMVSADDILHLCDTFPELGASHSFCAPTRYDMRAQPAESTSGTSLTRALLACLPTHRNPPAVFPQGGQQAEREGPQRPRDPRAEAPRAATIGLNARLTLVPTLAVLPHALAPVSAEGRSSGALPTASRAASTRRI